MASSHNNSEYYVNFAYGEEGALLLEAGVGTASYSGAYSLQRVVDLLRRVRLTQQQRAGLLLSWADFCPDLTAAQELVELGRQYMALSTHIHDCRQQLINQSALVDNANYGLWEPRPEGRFESRVDTDERFFPLMQPPITAAKQNTLAERLERYFVPAGKGHMALQALGLEGGRMADRVVWMDDLASLALLVLMLLGKITVEVPESVGLEGDILPAGHYGQGRKLIGTHGSDRHWQIVSRLFCQNHGKEIKANSLRTIAARLTPLGIVSPKGQVKPETHRVAFIFYCL